MTPFRIVKRTARRVFIEQHLYYGPEFYLRRATRPENWTDQYIPTFALDRQTLERDGEVWCQQDRGHFYVRPELPYQPQRDTPPCLALLGLSWPCREQDIKHAFRQLSLESHPDRGGDATAFMALQESYQRALQVVRVRAATTQCYSDGQWGTVVYASPDLPEPLRGT